MITFANWCPFTSTILIWHVIECHGSPSHSWNGLADGLTPSSLNSLERQKCTKEGRRLLTNDICTVCFPSGARKLSHYCLVWIPRDCIQSTHNGEKNPKNVAGGWSDDSVSALPVCGHVLLLGSLCWVLVGASCPLVVCFLCSAVH